LYHPVSKEQISSAQEQKVMELNEMLGLVDELFPPETGIYKKGARFEEKITLLYFNFPRIIGQKYDDTIKELEKRTGWTVEINTQCNLSAFDPLIRTLLGEEQKLLLRVSYYALQNEVKAVFSAKPTAIDLLSDKFEECTGVKMLMDYPEKSSSSSTFVSSSNLAVDPNKKVMEQNTTFSLIDQVFSEAEDQLYKKSLKSDANGKYIELSFISPFIGEKYISWIEDLSKETNWPIKINPMANQAEITQVALRLLHQNSIYPKKNPSILVAERKTRIKLAETPPTELWETIGNDFEKQTGFILEYTL